MEEEDEEDEKEMPDLEEEGEKENERGTPVPKPKKKRKRKTKEDGSTEEPNDKKNKKCEKSSDQGTGSFTYLTSSQILHVCCLQLTFVLFDILRRSLHT